MAQWSSQLLYPTLFFYRTVIHRKRRCACTIDIRRGIISNSIFVVFFFYFIFINDSWVTLARAIYTTSDATDSRKSKIKKNVTHKTQQTLIHVHTESIYTVWKKNYPEALEGTAHYSRLWLYSTSIYTSTATTVHAIFYHTEFII